MRKWSESESYSPFFQAVLLCLFAKRGFDGSVPKALVDWFPPFFLQLRPILNHYKQGLFYCGDPLHHEPIFFAGSKIFGNRSC